eukprot:scaffold267919_cov23-Prasinocladus_malaysianus.AAC.1
MSPFILSRRQTHFQRFSASMMHYVSYSDVVTGRLRALGPPASRARRFSRHAARLALSIVLRGGLGYLPKPVASR